MPARTRRKQAKKHEPRPEEVRSMSLWPFASAIVAWLSFAPVGFSLLAWIAPLGWIHEIERPGRLRRRHYFGLWLSGCVFWLLILQGIRLAYWPLYFGWLALSLYLAVYIPLFVWGARTLRSQGIPLFLSAPVSWVAMEFARSYVITGYCANMLAHSQFRYPMVTQIADQLGAYGISFVMMTSCAAVYGLLTGYRRGRLQSAWLGSSVAVVLILVTLAYGAWRLRQADEMANSSSPLISVLLVQENTPTVFDAEEQGLKIAWTRYEDATQHGVSEHGIPDLVVWPESTFTAGIPFVGGTLPTRLGGTWATEDVDRAYLGNWMERMRQEFQFKVDLVSRAARGGDNARDSTAPGETSDLGESEAATKPYLLLGSDAMEIGELDFERFNSALFINPDGQVAGRYDKMHLVMFGEYIPLGPLLKWLRDMFGIKAVPGREVQAFDVGGVRVSPNICFESMMPRIISGQVRELVAAGTPPDVLVNLSNDSWFRGSAMLDHHLACSVLCAVENRRPMLVAANTGLSAEIDGSGRLLQLTERFEVRSLLASPIADARWGLVQTVGYPLAWICMVWFSVSVLLAWRQSRRSSREVPR